MMLGDNIYHKEENGTWMQEDSHHSNQDGSPCLDNLIRDTGKTDQVLISKCFFYFGDKAQSVDLNSIGYNKIRNYKKIKLTTSHKARDIITSIFCQNRNNLNILISDPCQFLKSHERVNQETGKKL